jgi:hypothetical protein
MGVGLRGNNTCDGLYSLMITLLMLSYLTVAVLAIYLQYVLRAWRNRRTRPNEISHGVWLVKHCLWRHGDVPVGYGSEA